MKSTVLHVNEFGDDDDKKTTTMILMLMLIMMMLVLMLMLMLVMLMLVMVLAMMLAVMSPTLRVCRVSVCEADCTWCGLSFGRIYYVMLSRSSSRRA